MKSLYKSPNVAQQLQKFKHYVRIYVHSSIIAYGHSGSIMALKICEIRVNANITIHSSVRHQLSVIGSHNQLSME